MHVCVCVRACVRVCDIIQNGGSKTTCSWRRLKNQAVLYGVGSLLLLCVHVGACMCICTVCAFDVCVCMW